MRTAHTQSRRDDRGAAAVEFALVLPLLLLLVFGIVDFGLAYNKKVTLTHAAREGVRMLALNGSMADVQTALDPTSSTSISPLNGVTIDPTSTACTPGQKNAVLVLSSDFKYVTPLPGLAGVFGGGGGGFGNVVTIKSKAVMRCGG